MNLTTRPATDADKDFARRAHHSAYKDVVIAQFGEWDEAAQDQFFEKGWSSTDFVILFLDDEPCGYAAYDELPDSTGIRELVIHVDFQGRGIGSAFLRRIMDAAEARDVPVQLGTFQKNRAVHFYRKRGFREFDRTDTHILMEWRG